VRQFRRSARFNRLLKEEISDIVRTRLRDPRIGLVTVSRVEATEDLRSCKVYVSTLEDERGEEILAGLDSAASLIRRELRHRVHARRIPELRFILDRNIAYSIHIAEVLNKLKSDEEGKDDEDR